MGCEVDPLAGAAEHGHDAEACGECDPGSALGGMHAMSAPGGEAGQHTDQAEYACRGTDRAMGGAVVDGVGEVAEGAADEERKDRTAKAESAGERRQEEAAEERIARHVGEVCMKGEGRQRSPYLS